MAPTTQSLMTRAVRSLARTAEIHVIVATPLPRVLPLHQRLLMPARPCPWERPSNSNSSKIILASIRDPHRRPHSTILRPPQLLLETPLHPRITITTTVGAGVAAVLVAEVAGIIFTKIIILTTQLGEDIWCIPLEAILTLARPLVQIDDSSTISTIIGPVEAGAAAAGVRAVMITTIAVAVAAGREVAVAVVEKIQRILAATAAVTTTIIITTTTITSWATLLCNSNSNSKGIKVQPEKVLEQPPLPPRHRHHRHRPIKHPRHGPEDPQRGARSQSLRLKTIKAFSQFKSDLNNGSGRRCLRSRRDPINNSNNSFLYKCQQRAGIRPCIFLTCTSKQTNPWCLSKLSLIRLLCNSNSKVSKLPDLRPLSPIPCNSSNSSNNNNNNNRPILLTI
mmetsp:Transcript_21354/g.38369  ORF Transcript_21354/g.38369 Transcript_21354/m.38369 type:complete len:394 (-) Transcript_21354:649-1830(-)